MISLINKKNALNTQQFKNHTVTILNDCHGFPKKCEILLSEKEKPIEQLLIQIGSFKPYLLDTILIHSMANKYNILYYISQKKLFITFKQKSSNKLLKEIILKLG